MAARNVTVLNPAGYQEQLPDTDNIVLTLLPTDNVHGANKKYVDDTTTALGNLLNDKIDDLEITVDGKLDLYVLKTGSTMTGTLDWKNDTDNITASIDRLGVAEFQYLDVNFNMSAGSAQFSGTVTCDLGLDVGGDLSVGGDISAINGDFTGDVSLANITVNQINLRTSNAGADGYINSQNFRVDEPILTIKNTGPLDIEGNAVDIKGVTTIETSLRVGNFSDFVYMIGGDLDTSGDIHVNGTKITLSKTGFINAKDSIVSDRSQASYGAFVAQTNGSSKATITAGGDATFDGDLVASTLTGDIDAGTY